MKLEDALAFTEKCFNGEPASCSFACPFHLDIRAFLDKAEKGKWASAYKALESAVAFPLTVSLLCDAPCEHHCQRVQLGDEPIAMTMLEAAVVRYAGSKRARRYVIPPKEGRVAIVGAGAAGLACALGLARKRISVTVFEREPEYGGALRRHPRFAEMSGDIKLQFEAVDAEFCFGREIKSLGELADYNAVYVATGAGGEHFGLLDGWKDDAFTGGADGVFLGGELTGASVVEGIARGGAAAQSIEAFLQVGRVTRLHGGYDREGCERYVAHDGAARAPRVTPSSPDGYTEDEAIREAARCLQCDCDRCMTSCEMLRAFRKRPHKIATEVYTDQNANPPYSSHTLTRETYSCNMCGYCKSVCPEGVDIGALLRLSRAQRMSAGKEPAALHDFWLREMDFNSGEAALCEPPPGAQTCEYVFFPGCQLGASNPEHVRGAYGLLRSAGGGAGIYLGCCGAPAWWAGDDKRFMANFAAIRRNWENMGRPVFVFACATCAGVFDAFAPDIRSVSLYELLDDREVAGHAGELTRAVVFDPCSARARDGMRAAVRGLLRRAGIRTEELADRGRCCGYGGQMRVANPKLFDEIVNSRASMSDEPYIVYCANCREVFASHGKRCAHVLDVALGLKPQERVPSISEKRRNSLSLKEEFMMSDRDARPYRAASAWDAVTLIIDGRLREDMDRNLISEDDVREAIFSAEESGDVFVDAGDGTRMCSMVKPVLTYWARYRCVSRDTYEVLDAYYHRMRFESNSQS
ncbi:MAG: FAD-dependent oxidoreductase [Oscillospiraceae bacterium]|jgi:NADPH-dependent glutamate synthase beta subunit-like oxidoreductase|nr:FAD-dependent oxidoreductase [Oscillospiraceae bacterium]